jgi:inosine-uridine nucleoside N-ribohydrolase
MKLIIDCDPGHDDAIAILYAARHVDVVGITTIFGNQTVEKTTLNALRVLTLAGLDIPVAKGCSEPLVGDAPLAPDTHGASGLDGVELPDPAAPPVEEHAVRFLIDTAFRYRGQIALAITGAHTNVALALRIEPRLRDWVTGISIMGGTVGVGNLRPQACVNILSDPEAAHIVFSSGIPIHWIGYETTRTVLMTTEDIARLRRTNLPVASAVADIAAYYRDRQLAVNGIDGAPMHDACAIIPFVSPGIIRYEPAHLAVALDTGIARGMTVVDRRPLRTGTALSSVLPRKPDNILMAAEVDRAALIAEIVSAVSSYR